MIKLPDGKIIVGFDNGYQYAKTANSLFENGVLSGFLFSPNVIQP